MGRPNFCMLNLRLRTSGSRSFLVATMVLAVTFLVFVIGVSRAQADSFELQAPNNVVVGKDFVMTAHGSVSSGPEADPSGAQVTIDAKPRSESCPAAPPDYGMDGLRFAWLGTAPTENNAIESWPVAVPRDFSEVIGSSTDSLGPPGAYRLCAWVFWNNSAGTNSYDPKDRQQLLAQALITLKPPPTDRSAQFRRCSAQVARISALSATRATSCIRAVSDVRSFARSTCATRDGILLRTLGGQKFSYCHPQRRLECVALAYPKRSRVPVACGRIGSLGFVDNERLQFTYRLRQP
jgi:hypothetical protein